MDEMRGQAKDLTRVAMRLCRSRFPARPQLDEAEVAQERLDFSSQSEPAQAVDMAPLPQPKPQPTRDPAALPDGFDLDESSLN